MNCNATDRIMDVGVELSSAGDQHRHSTVSAISGAEQMHKSDRLTDAAPSVGQTNPAYDHTEQVKCLYSRINFYDS